MEITQLVTIKDVVHYSLLEAVKSGKRKATLDLKGKVKWEGNLVEMRSHE